MNRHLHTAAAVDLRHRLFRHPSVHRTRRVYRTLLDYIKKLKDESLDIYDCLDFMQLWYRDVLMYKVTQDINLLVFKEEYNTIKEMSASSAYDGIEKILQSIDKAGIRLNANVNMELAMELMLLVMKEN